MSLSKMTGLAAVLLALAPTAMAGTATVVNNCGFPIYFASVGQSQHANMAQMQGSYSESYGEQGNGISIKLSPSEGGPVSQFEITPSGGKIFYDLSNIDGYPFADGGMSLSPSMSNDPNNPTCVPIDCPAGDSVCTAAYNQPDDTRTHVCSEQANLVLTMCPGGSSSGSGAESGSGSSTGSPSASSAPAATSDASYPQSTGSWPKRSIEHGHQRAHSRAFRV